MAKGIGRTHKLVKQNRHHPVFANGPFKTTAIDPNNLDIFNKDILKFYQEPIITTTYTITSKYH